MKWNHKGTPPSDPEKRYLVVYCPWDFNRNQHDAHYIRFDIASYYTGDGSYSDKPWHLSVTQSVMEKEIVAWADVGDAKDFVYSFTHREPKPCPICGKRPVRKQMHFAVGEGENRYDNEHPAVTNGMKVLEMIPGNERSTTSKEADTLLKGGGFITSEDYVEMRVRKSWWNAEYKEGE